jgi:hypothetical protein
MTDLNERLSRIEGAQHFQTAMIGALAKTVADDPAFARHVRENLLRHQALLAGESTDDVKVKAFEELMEEILGRDH